MPSRQIIFDAITASETIELHTLDSMAHSVNAGSLLFEVVGTGPPEWSIDIEGKVHEDGNYESIDWVETFIGGKGVLANTQIRVRGLARRFYLVPHPPQLVRLVATLSKGTLSVYGSVGAVFGDDLTAATAPLDLSTLERYAALSEKNDKEIIRWLRKIAEA